MKTALAALALTALLLPAAARAADSFEIERLERSCALQRESLLRERNGTPACDALKRAKTAKAKRQAEASDRPSEKSRRGGSRKKAR